MPFTLCLNTSTIKPQPILEKIRLAAEAGFAGVELWINDVYEYVGRGGEVGDIEKAIADHGLIVPCAIAVRGWGEAVGPEYPIVLDEVKRRMEMAARLGSPYLVATPPREACADEQLIERYRDLLRIGREAGVRPTFEYISFFGSVSRLSHCWELVRAVDDPHASLILDSFHTYNGGGSLDELRDIPLDKISHYHIDDASPDKPLGTQTDPDRVMPGDGSLDLAAEIALLNEKGYHGTVSLELFNKDLWAKDPREVLKLGIERMRELME